MKQIQGIVVTVLVILMTACGGKSWQKNPVDALITELDKEKTYSIVLYDMDLNSNDDFVHKYKIITNLEDEGKKKERVTDWMVVPDKFFEKNQDNLGMELVAKGPDGKISKIPAPPGYANYVGNEKYGSWQTNSSGQSFWAFYGQYMFMSSMFHMATAPVYRSGYTTYRNNYYGRRPYYGSSSSGGARYGTNGSTTRNTNRSNFFSRNKGNTANFKSRVNSRVQRSRSTSRSRSGSGGSSRSRSGGYGK